MFLSTFHLTGEPYTYIDEITIPASILRKNLRILNFMVKREIWAHQVRLSPLAIFFYITRLHLCQVLHLVIKEIRIFKLNESSRVSSLYSF